MTLVVRRSLLAGARAASGATVVIDVFRAFTTAAFAVAGGAERIILASELNEARAISDSIEGGLLVGESGGIRPPDFDLGNSPAEMLAHPGVPGATIVQRTSAGTRAAGAALDAGAEPLYAASLVVAGATGTALMDHDRVTLVASGRDGKKRAEEDEACADYLERVLSGDDPDAAAAVGRAAEGPGAARLRSASWAHPDDLGLCLDVDRFRFALRVEHRSGLVELVRVDP